MYNATKLYITFYRFAIGDRPLLTLCHITLSISKLRVIIKVKQVIPMSNYISTDLTYFSFISLLPLLVNDTSHHSPTEDASQKLYFILFFRELNTRAWPAVWNAKKNKKSETFISSYAALNSAPNSVNLRRAIKTEDAQFCSFRYTSKPQNLTDNKTLSISS